MNRKRHALQRRPAGQLDGSGNLAATVAADRAFPAAVAGSLAAFRVMTTTPSTRVQVRELLQLLASEEQQLDYERDVPRDDIMKELVCMWFDDLYHPGAGFDPFFSPAELSALDEFSRFYEGRLGHLPKSQGTVRTWLGGPVWREVMEQARRTLERVATS